MEKVGVGVMKKVGLFQKSAEKTRILEEIKSSLKESPEKWRAIPNTINEFGYYPDERDQPSTIIKNDGFLLRICTADTVFSYSFWQSLIFESLTPRSAIDLRPLPVPHPFGRDFEM
jgi:hypothetical protein